MNDLILQNLDVGKLSANKRVDDYHNGFSAKTAAFTAEDGYEYLVADADGCAIVLPAATAGARIAITLSGDVTSNTTTITAAAGDLLNGYAFVRDEADGAANDFVYWAADGTDDLIVTLNGGTKGGLIGDRIELVGRADGWNVRAVLSGTGTLVTVFS
jgi:hypothetical protein